MISSLKASTLLALALAAAGCAGHAAEVRKTTGPSGPFEPGTTIRLDRPVQASQLTRFGDSIFLTEPGPAFQVSRFGIDGEDRGPVFRHGRAPWQTHEASEDLLLGPDGTLGLIDMRAYRLAFVDPRSNRFRRSFLVSGYEFMPLGGAGDPARDRIYLFTNNVPEVRVLDYAGRLRGAFDHFDETYTDPYVSFRGVVDDRGDLLYTPRSSYRVLRVSADGRATPFAGPVTPDYRNATPVPEAVRADLKNNDSRWAWEKTVSWIDRLASSGRYVVVSYSVPPGMDRFRADLYRSDGSLVAAAVETPGKLLGCDEDGQCWFLTPSGDEIVSRRIVS